MTRKTFTRNTSRRRMALPLLQPLPRQTSRLAQGACIAPPRPQRRRPRPLLRLPLLVHELHRRRLPGPLRKGLVQVALARRCGRALRAWATASHFLWPADPNLPWPAAPHPLWAHRRASQRPQPTVAPQLQWPAAPQLQWLGSPKLQWTSF